MTLRIPAFRRMCARDELSLPLLTKELTPELTRLGLAAEDAEAVSANTAFLYLVIDWKLRPASPSALLDLYSLGEIADLYGAYRDYEAGTHDYGVNESYGEAAI